MTRPTNLSDESKELIGLFLSHGVEFLVVGAHALAFYGHPRFTQDLDIFLKRSKQNASRVRTALEEFGFKLTDNAESELAENPRAMMVLGRKPGEVDLLNFLDGVDFDTAWRRRAPGTIADLEVSFIGLEDYIATKRASGRQKDLDDLNRLRETLGHALPDE